MFIQRKVTTFIEFLRAGELGDAAQSRFNERLHHQRPCGLRRPCIQDQRCKDLVAATPVATRAAGPLRDVATGLRDERRSYIHDERASGLGLFLRLERLEHVFDGLVHVGDPCACEGAATTFVTVIRSRWRTPHRQPRRRTGPATLTAVYVGVVREHESASASD